MNFTLDTKPGPIVLLSRHGKTKGNNPAKPKIRGWDDVQLTPQGKFEAQLFAYRMKPYEPKAIFHSDFMRDSETAHILAEALEISDLNTDFDARTWDTGTLSGQPEEEAEPVIAEIYKSPWLKAPGGSESLSDFFARWGDFVNSKMEMASKIHTMRPLLLITHGRNIATTYSQLKQIPMDQGQMPFPGGFAVIQVLPDRSLDIQIQGPSEPILKDV